MFACSLINSKLVMIQNDMVLAEYTEQQCDQWLNAKESETTKSWWHDTLLVSFSSLIHGEEETQEPSGNLHISGDLQTYNPSTSNKLDFLISVPVRLVEASCNWFHFVLLLDKHRPELPNRGRLIRQRAITTWNWVCIGDAPWVIRLKSQPEQFTRFVIYQQARN